MRWRYGKKSGDLSFSIQVFNDKNKCVNQPENCLKPGVVSLPTLVIH